MESQLCCTTKLLKAMGTKPSDAPPERGGLPPLSTWYADVFVFNRRKCLVFCNPSTGYCMVAAYVTKKRIANLGEVLLRTYRDALKDDGVPSQKADELLAVLASPTICRTSDRKSRAHVVQVIREAKDWMWDSVLSDPLALERDAHLWIVRTFRVHGGYPVMALAHLIGEGLKDRPISSRLARDFCQVMVTLEDIDPPIWRRILVPSACKLDRCHLVIQGAFGWTDTHLHFFRAGGKTFEAIDDPNEDVEGEDETMVGFFDLLQMGGGTAEYVYDYGDHWRHTIRLESRVLYDAPSETKCVDGERACPPENVGGPPGYAQMLQALADPASEDHATYTDWLPENYNPEAFSVGAANDLIQILVLTRLL